MKKKITVAVVFSFFALFSTAQNLDSLTLTLKTDGSNYLSIANKRAYQKTEAISVKQFIDLALITTKTSGKQNLEWYNMSGKDGKIPKKMIGTATLINAISLDKDQYTQCKTTQDLRRMTGHLTNNSFSHFASITDNMQKGIIYHCFILQMENGKRALLWIETEGNTSFTVMVKREP